MTGGAAECRADDHPAASSAAAPPSWSLAKLVVCLPRSLVDLAEAGLEADHEEVDNDAIRSFISQRWAGERAQEGLRGEVVAEVLAGAQHVARRSSSGAPPELLVSVLNWLDAAAHAVAGVFASRDGSGSDSGSGGEGSSPPTLKRTLRDLRTFQLPNQTNRLALVFDPMARTPVPFVFGVEIFEPGHRTEPHVHPSAHEAFFILAGEGEAFCEGERFPVGAGDVVVFRPGCTHGIDNTGESRVYCLEMMLPNENFAELVRAGKATGRLQDDDLCVLAKVGCA